jgi:serine/threonine protein kinase
MADPTELGQWRIIKRLGSGGNADVYRATDGSQEVALKVLMNKKPESEPYARFRNEISVVRRFAGDEGVLPIIDASLPERPNKNDPAWIAMPVAKRIRDELSEADLRKIVMSVAEISRTLARVAAEGIAHRDVKPDNLYHYEGRPVVSDFGIAHIPDPTELCLTGDRLGPFGFTPDELIENPPQADPYPVDVFQLAKTLLVLVSGAPYPPQGHIAAGTSGALTRYVAEPRAEQLDDLIDRCTRREPTARPTMENVARELSAWLEDVPMRGEPEIENLLAQFRHAHQDAFDKRAQRDAWLERFHEITEQVTKTTLTWVAQTLTEAGLRPELTDWHDHSNWLERMRGMGMHSELASDQLWIVAEFGDSYFPTKIAVGIGLDVNLVGEFWCRGYVAWGDMDSTATRQLQVDDKIAPIESLEIPILLEQLDREIQQACVAMLEELSGETEALGG